MLPVVVLSAIAFYFLRQDRAFVEQEARERLGTLAPELARRVGQRAGELAARRQSALQGSILRGRIVAPPDYEPLPVPPAWPTRLTPAELRLREAADQAMLQRSDFPAARKSLTELVRLGTGPEVRANAEFDLLRSSGPAKLLEFSRRVPRVTTESGVPLADVALLAALRAMKPGPLPAEVQAELQRHIEERPSFLTPELLEQAAKIAGEIGVRGLRQAWSAAETTRRVLREKLRVAPAEAEAWVEDGGQLFLTLAAPSGQVTLLSSRQVEELFRDALATEHASVPAYAAASIEVAQRRWPREQLSLASAAGEWKLGAVHPFRFHLALADRDLLFAAYRRRVWFIGGLILSAALTALLGVFNLRETLRRQQRLTVMQSNFVSAVSHELRAPIGAVCLLAETLEQGKIEAQRQPHYLRLIVQQCRRLGSLADNVLDFSRMDSGSRQYAFEPLDLMPLLHATAALMEPYAAERQVGLKVVPPADGVTSLRPSWDRQAVEQSLVNLLDNSIKHSPVGAEVHVEVEVQTPETLRIWVEDRGPGIPKEAQSRIFDLFYRHGSELRRETKGAGIGLSIVKQITEAHGGRVLVESVVGQGSRFGLELPMVAHHG